MSEAAKPVDHASADPTPDPDIAVDDPDQVALGFTIGPAHVPDLGVWAKVGSETVRPRGVIVLLFDEDPGIVVGVVVHHFFKARVGAVRARRNAQVHCYLVGRVVLEKGRSEAFVEVRLKALARSNDSNMRDACFVI